MTSQRAEQVGCPWPQRGWTPAGRPTLDSPFLNLPEPQLPHLWRDLNPVPGSLDDARDQTSNARGPKRRPTAPCALRKACLALPLLTASSLSETGGRMKRGHLRCWSRGWRMVPTCCSWGSSLSPTLPSGHRLSSSFRNSWLLPDKPALHGGCRPASCLYFPFPALLGTGLGALLSHGHLLTAPLLCSTALNAPNAEAPHWGLQSQDSTVNNT